MIVQEALDLFGFFALPSSDDIGSSPPPLSPLYQWTCFAVSAVVTGSRFPPLE